MDKQFLTELALIKIGTTDIKKLDGLTFIYESRWFNFYVNKDVVVIEEIK